ncbi:MAG: cytochrome c oxidase assembly protein [Alphaproteobacteria bacterium]|nr:cytochrome c oxidase assembly protein [Alphaproteobacteria bacterium]
MAGRADNRRRTALALFGLVAGMAALTAASVPLYRLFCQVTGFGGTPRVAIAAPEGTRPETVVVRFDANVSRELPWRFEPVQREMTVRLGENVLAFYRATNLSARPVTGAATFNVTPDIAGPHFNKLACFCFTEQTLAPGESIEMPVSFFVDPALLDDLNARGTTAITLSYTFFTAPGPRQALTATRPPGG